MRGQAIISRSLLVMLLFCACWSITAFTCEVPSIDVADREFLLTKEWKAISITHGSNESETTVVDSYRLQLGQDFGFVEKGLDEATLIPYERSGTWNIVANMTQLELDYGDSLGIKKHQIISLKHRELQLELTSDSMADPDPNEIEKIQSGQDPLTRFVLVPVKE